MTSSTNREELKPYDAYEGFLNDTRDNKAATFHATNHPGQKLYNQQAVDALLKDYIHRSTVEEAIGEDEPFNVAYALEDHTKPIRNNLRKEIRERLGL